MGFGCFQKAHVSWVWCFRVAVPPLGKLEEVYHWGPRVGDLTWEPVSLKAKIY